MAIAKKPKQGEETPKDEEEVETPEVKKEEVEKPKTYTQAELDALLKKAQKDADKKIADAEAKAKLSEDERMKKDLEDTKAQLRERDARDAVKEAASKAGVKNPDLFYKAVKTDLEFNEDGSIKNLKDVLESSKTEMPELYGEVEKPKPEGGADAGEGKNPPPTLTKEAIEKMSEKEIMDNMPAIDAFLASQ
ncbi:MAG: hypothetical protein LUM44_09795 [Pyrinomonadaceae bacterium]|nr:hypothetical protein [Pyrinomonadaceae bacterium]